MKPIQTIDSTCKTRFYGTRLIYISISEMHAKEIGRDYPVIYGLHILNVVFGWVWLHKEK